jgi:signal transduction histidine kinase
MTSTSLRRWKIPIEGGWVGVHARVGQTGVEMSVSDRGVGIAPDELSQVFDRFFRSSDPRVRSHRGTGIGLTIVRYIVDMHGGQIRVDSAPQRGTTFTIIFPLEPRETGA